MLRRKAEQPYRTKFDRMREADLETALETSLSQTAKLYRGITHKEIDRAWLLAEMETQALTVLQVVQALRRKL